MRPSLASSSQLCRRTPLAPQRLEKALTARQGSPRRAGGSTLRRARGMFLTRAAAFAFTPLPSLAGGLTLGVLASSHLLLTGRVLGISGITRGLLTNLQQAWRLSFVLGLVGGGGLLHLLLPSAFEVVPAGFSIARAVTGGLLVGLGTALGSGCTSGHGICGNARLSVRSLAATAAFMAAGALSAWATRAPALYGLPAGIAPLGPTGAAWALGLPLLAVACAGSTGLALCGRASTAGPGASPLREPLDAGVNFFNGLLFALALGVSGMTQPSKVVGFLSVLRGTWDPSLMLVMGGALLVAVPAFTLVTRLAVVKRPIVTMEFQLPTAKAVDARLLLGSALFGAGWGMTGLCPGPAIVGIATMQPRVLLFVASMIAGWQVEALLGPSKPQPTAAA